MLAMRTDELILIHTPHPEDKHKGTMMILDMLKNDRRVKPERARVDHADCPLFKGVGHRGGRSRTSS